MNRFTIIAAWLLATGLATVIAWQVVGAADDQITNAPLTPVVAVATSGSETSQPAGESTTPDSSTTTSDTAAASTVPRTSTTPSTSRTSTSPPSSGVSSTTSPSSETSTSTTGIPATTTAVSDGGTVTVTGTEPRVGLVAVVAAPGWTYEVTANNGESVEVRFENAAGNDVRIRCEWEDGRLIAEIDD